MALYLVILGGRMVAMMISIADANSPQKRASTPDSNSGIVLPRIIMIVDRWHLLPLIIVGNAES